MYLNFQLKSRGQWKHWNDLIKTSQIPATQKIKDILVPTVDTIRYTYLMDICIKHQRFVVCNGRGNLLSIL